MGISREPSAASTDEDLTRGDAEALRRHECSRYRAAAAHARHILHGPLGELVARELTAYADFGYRFTGDALIPRLATQILATPSEDAAA